MFPEPLGYRSRRDDEADLVPSPLARQDDAYKPPFAETASAVSLWCFGVWVACLCIAISGMMMARHEDPGLSGLAWIGVIACSGALLIPLGFVAGLVSVFGRQPRRLRAYLGMTLNALVLLLWMLLKFRVIRL